MCNPFALFYYTQFSIGSNLVRGTLGILEGSNGFVVRFWFANLSSEGFEVRPLGFEAVRSSLLLGSTQH